MNGRWAALGLLAMVGCGRTEPLRYRPDDSAPATPADEQLDPRCPADIDTYTLPPAAKRPVDVLFVIDDSCSMKNDQDALAANFDSFIGSFQTRQVDFQLGAVTTDMKSPTRSGRLVAPFLGSQTPELKAAFKAMVSVGTQGSSNEQGLAAAAAALSEPLASAENAGFLRDQADLGLVFITDENDHSPITADDFVAFVRGLKPDTGAITVAAIVGLGSSVFCALDAGRWKYVQVASAFGANSLTSVCSSDYRATLESVGGRIVSARCIVGLSRPLPEDTTLFAVINGVPGVPKVQPPDLAYPNGSVELTPCPLGGGSVELVYQRCP